MSDEYQSPFFDPDDRPEENTDDTEQTEQDLDLYTDEDNDLYSTSENQLDLNSFVKPKHKAEEETENGKHSSRRKKGKKKTKKKAWRIALTGLLIFAIAFCIIIASFAIYVFGFVDDVVPENLNDLKLNFTTTIYLKDNETGEYYEYQRLHGDENRIWVSFDKMSQDLRDAFVSIEDQRFYDHNGVDWKRTLSAFVNMFVSIYDTNQGGSTITQQLVKNLTGDKTQSPMRKIREIMRARYLEDNYSKDTILECYLNTASFANGICGVEVAANYYFDKHTEELTLAECATLAAIVKYPEKYRPDTHPEDNKERRLLVLDKMLELGKITQEEYDKASTEEVKIVADSSKLMEKEVNSYFVDALIDNVVDELVEKYDYDRAHATNNFYNGGYKIYCTIDPDIQEIIDETYTDSDNFSKSKSGQIAQSSFTIMDYSGHVVGIAGGSGEKKENRSLNRATSSPRPPGSTMKPIGAYAPALENNLITYSTYLKDQPIGTHEGKKWPPNWYGYYGGSVPVFKALERSINTIPAQLVQQLGLDKSFDFLTQNLGITTLEKDADKDLTYSSLALGGSYRGITTLEQAAAYATFGNLGYYYKPTFFTQVTDQHGTVILEEEEKPSVAMGEDTANIMNRLLYMPVYGSQGTGRSAASYVPHMKIFAKTGTTDATNDLWFVGGTPYYVASCWYGYDMPESVSSSSSARRIWGEIMSKVHKDLPAKDYPQSSYVTIRRYCASTGLVANSNCPIGGTGYYKTSYMPTCTQHGGSVLGAISSTYQATTSKEESSTSSKTSTSSKASSSTSSKTSSTATSAPSSSSNAPVSSQESSTPAMSSTESSSEDNTTSSSGQD